ncbi:MAG: NusG domain II-containing protein [bacterium]
MDRRKFIKQCTFFVSGVTVFRSTGFLSDYLYANNKLMDNFSLNLITNSPDKAIAMVGDLIKQSNLKDKNVKFIEYPISGTHVGDIVLIRNNNLVDFRNANDNLTKNVLKLSKELGLPKNLENPVFLKFYTENDKLLTPKRVNIFYKNILIKQFDVDENMDSFDIQGAKGNVTISVKNKTVKINFSSCKHKTCVKMGSITKPGQNLVCIPNQIRIAIEGENEFNIDTLAY